MPDPVEPLSATPHGRRSRDGGNGTLTPAHEPVWLERLMHAFDGPVDEPKYKVIAGVLEGAIRAGTVKADEKLPTVRELSKAMSVSGTTISAAYRVLTQQGLLTSRVGSGTRVALGAESPAPARRRPTNDRTRVYWRRRTQTTHIIRLQDAFPKAANYATGTPNLALLPLEALRHAWHAAVDAMRADDLQYFGPAPVSALARALAPRLEEDLVPARAADLMVGTSAQQLMTLALLSIASYLGRTPLSIAVEQPGYPTIMDTYERLGHRLIGVEVDDHGAVPASVIGALEAGANVVLLTPRAHNPTGVSWSPARLRELADVFAAHPETFVIEDDQFADAVDVRSGSLLGDPRIEDRVVYVRSFSKAIAPDLRLAIAATRPRLRSLLLEEKFFADGWCPRLSQHALATSFASGSLDAALADAAATYARQRRELTGALVERIGGRVDIRVPPATGSVNVWIQLPQGLSATEVAERAAEAGMIVATGEPFFIGVGHDDALRVNAGSVPVGLAPEVGQVLGSVIVDVATSTSSTYLHHNL